MPFFEKYVLDTLQIYFPWDDDLYSFLKTRGLMSKRPDLKVLPLIYSDNCENTISVKEVKRNYVIDPVKYGLREEVLGWQRSGKKQFIISSERPELHVLSEENSLKFKIVPKPREKNEYHIEYSVMSAFGKLYSNWVAFYLSINVAKKFIDDLFSFYKINRDIKEVSELKIEIKQNQRESMYWAYVRVHEYCFSIAEFDYAVRYLRESGVSGNLPALTFNSNDPNHLQLMDPYMKLGIIETQEKMDLWPRNVQLAMKIAQDKMIIGQREKKIKVKGVIDDSGLKENYIKLSTTDFINALLKIFTWYNAQPNFKLKL